MKRKQLVRPTKRTFFEIENSLRLKFEASHRNEVKAALWEYEQSQHHLDIVSRNFSSRERKHLRQTIAVLNRLIKRITVGKREHFALKWFRTDYREVIRELIVLRTKLKEMDGREKGRPKNDFLQDFLFRLLSRRAPWAPGPQVAEDRLGRRRG